MSKKATEFQRKAMSRMYRGKEIFKPLNTGWIDEAVCRSCRLSESERTRYEI